MRIGGEVVVKVVESGGCPRRGYVRLKNWEALVFGV